MSRQINEWWKKLVKKNIFFFGFLFYKIVHSRDGHKKYKNKKNN